NMDIQTLKEVSGVKGKSVILSCTFTHSNDFSKGPVRAIWRRNDCSTGPVYFQCDFHSGAHNDSNNNCMSISAGKSRSRLAGNLQEGNISLQIENLEWGDSGWYCCGVDFTQIPGTNWTSPVPTKLNIKEPASISRLSVSSTNTIVCTAEGDPLPNITWIGPQKTLQQGIVTSASENHTRTEFLHVKEDGDYICVAENEHGKDE
uniref:Ig-like domain-containing protein n=1 Tax=Latimeria chalumnae TaxID=7897 RepID=H3ADD8_LATCH